MEDKRVFIFRIILDVFIMIVMLFLITSDPYNEPKNNLIKLVLLSIPLKYLIGYIITKKKIKDLNKGAAPPHSGR